MTKTLKKEELVRSAWLVELRRQKHRQCPGSRDGDKVCALVLLAEMTGGMPKTSRIDVWTDIGARAGLSPGQSSRVIGMNDQMVWATTDRPRERPIPIRHCYTFERIADTVEAWFR